MNSSVCKGSLEMDQSQFTASEWPCVEMGSGV